MSRMESWQFSAKTPGHSAEGAPVMNPVKRGICIDQDYENWIYGAHRISGLSENRVIVRLIEIGIESLKPFDDAGLRRILREPWEVAKKYPVLVKRIHRRSQDHLNATTATRLTTADKVAVQDLAEKSKTTVSAIQRQLLEGLIAKAPGRN